MMKSSIASLSFLLLILSCQTQLEEPKNLFLAVKSMNTLAGTASHTSFTPLLFKDQINQDDNSEKYIEFTPTSSAKVQFTFQVDEKYDLEEITQIAVVMNYNGETINNQEWLVKVKNGSSWNIVGNNERAKFDQWNYLKSFAQMSPGFLNGRSIAVEFSTTKDFSAAQLDYVSVVLNPTFLQDPPDPTPGAWWKPAIGTKWTIQYEGAIVEKPEYQIYNLDSYETPISLIQKLKSQGKRVICYFSAGSFENWRDDASQFPASVLGKKLEGWAGEKWLDIRALDILRPIMEARIKLAAAKGCDGVDPDNVDGYQNDSGFPLKHADQIAYNIMIAELAHSNGLAVGLKNDLDQVAELVHHYDYAVNEQCFQYNECDMLKPFIAQGKPVFNVEYELNTSNFCPKAKVLLFDSMKKKYDLDAWVTPCW